MTVVLEEEMVSFESSAQAAMSSRASVKRCSSSVGESEDSRAEKSSAKEVRIEGV